VSTFSSRHSRGAFLLGAMAAGLAPMSRLLGPTIAVAATPAVPAASSLGPLINVPQTWNNCGPATLAEVLSYWGVGRTQSQVQAALRVDGPTAGMTAYGIPSYVRGVGLRALLGVGGTPLLVKELIASGLPVIVHQVVTLADPVGHWRPIEAYDDSRAYFVASDPYLGASHVIAYGDFSQMWALRGNMFVVLYPAAKAALLGRLLASVRWNKVAAYGHDLALIQSGGLDTRPAGTPASAAPAYLNLALAWDAAQMGRAAMARAYLRMAVAAGANPLQANWVGATIGSSA
jgi:hypothetical protein